MGVICYKCPESGDDVATAIETGNDTLVKMRAMDLTIWVWCPHCMAGHQINPAEATLQDSTFQDEKITTESPSLAVS